MGFRRYLTRPAALAFALVTVLLTIGINAGIAGAAPVHAFLSADSLNGSTTPSGEFDNACGVAVDSKGDVYIANSANSAIDVFSPGGEYLTSIADPNLPCGLAVDSKGNVYAVDTASGNVVMFAPTGGAYPPTAGLTYEAAKAIDSSGNANAVAVNPANDHAFVNQGTQIVEYDSAAKGSAVVLGEIGKGTLVQGFGVDVYDATGNVYASDESGTVYVFSPAGAEVLTAIDGTGSPVGAFGALPQANIAVDQSNGHVLISDLDEGGAVYEFESTGPYLSTIEHEDLEDVEPSDLAVDPSEATATADRIYISSGPGPDSEVLAFAPLPVPTHPRLPALDPDPSETPVGSFNRACGVAVDSTGNVYVASSGTSAIDIFKPEGGELKYLTTITDENSPCGAAVDSAGNLYVAHPTALDTNVVVYKPNSYPFVGTPTYSAGVEVDAGGASGLYGIAVNPANDHLFVSYSNAVREYDSVANGSGLLQDDITGAGMGEASGLAVCGNSGNIFVVNNKIAERGVQVIDPAANELLRIINGSNAVSKKPDGGFGPLARSQLAVDQTDCHVYVSLQEGDVYEFEESGAYVSRFNRITPTGPIPGIAVDNSTGPNARDIFTAPGIAPPPSLVLAYKGPAQYGTPPQATTTGLSGANGTEATLEGTVDPGGVELSECTFEYVDEASFEASGFTTAAKVPCAESLEAIGEGDDPVPVHADVSGLTASTRYRYRLTVVNSFGADSGQTRLVGPPVAATEPPSEVLYEEATLAASVNASGLPTTYFFEYGPTASYGKSTAESTVQGEAPIPANASIFGLEQGTTYHYRLVATNAIGSTAGDDQAFTTLSEAPEESCPNAQFRIGLSANLPDCRAYELISPPDAGGRTLGDLRAGRSIFSAPMSTADGNGLLFYTEGALPGTNGNGVKDAYEARRTATGWSIAIASPNGSQIVGAQAGGVNAAHDLAFWLGLDQGGSLDPVDGETVSYLRDSSGAFEPIGLGQSEQDPDATGRWITPAGEKLIFTSEVPLTPGAPPSGTSAIYERTPDGSAQLLSFLPGDVVPAPGEDAIYEGASADGSAVAFVVGSTLYLRRNGETMSVASGNVSFGGLSADGTRLFYVALPGPTAPTAVQRGEAFRYDVGTETSDPIGSGGDLVLVNVSADGSHVYFVSGQQLDGTEGTLGAENLYAWDGASVDFIGVLDPEDLESAGAAQRLGMWGRAIAAWSDVFQGVGAAADPSRTNEDGSIFVFETTASLTSYDSDGRSEVYRYDAAGEQLACVSCPFGRPATADAALQTLATNLEQKAFAPNAPTDGFTAIPNIVADGSVIFETVEGLVPQDQNGARDVYQWKKGGVSLISSGIGGEPSYLYAVSPDGEDIFFATSVTLLHADVDNGARSIYDARVGGGFPSATAGAPCQADECKGPPRVPPSLPAPASSGPQPEATPPVRACPRRKRAIKRRGKTRCIPKAKRHGRRAAGANRKRGKR